MGSKEQCMDLRGEIDATVIIERVGAAGNMMIAINGSNAFIGLECPQGIFQYADRPADEEGTTRFVIAGTPADIDASYVTELESAIRVLKSWLEGGREASPGHWVRQ